MDTYTLHFSYLQKNFCGGGSASERSLKPVRDLVGTPEQAQHGNESRNQGPPLPYPRDTGATRMRIRFLRVAILSIWWTAVIPPTHAAEFSSLVKTVIDGDDIELCSDGGSCVGTWSTFAATRIVPARKSFPIAR
jgi:hypothetical protein